MPPGPPDARVRGALHVVFPGAFDAVNANDFARDG